MSIRNYEGIKIQGDQVSSTLDALTVEEALQVNVNAKPFTVSMRTPGHDPDLVRGLLHAEGIIKNANFHPEMFTEESKENGIISIVDVQIPERELGESYLNSRSLLSVSSCGICGKTELSDLSVSGRALANSSEIEPEMILNLFPLMRSVQHGFAESGGCHAAAAFNIRGELLCSREDIGRHNAVDKVVGMLIREKRLEEASFMSVSGRISYEIVVKCFKARIPVLAAVSAPSSLAVDFAKELGITLFAFCRDNRITCYAHPERISPLPKIKSQAS